MGQITISRLSAGGNVGNFLIMMMIIIIIILVIIIIIIMHEVIVTSEALGTWWLHVVLNVSLIF